MSKMISARIPDAIYSQACLQLESLGATTSDLVNAAFEYLIKERSLPGAKKSAPKRDKRVLPEEERLFLKAFFDDCTLGIDMPDDIAADKRYAREMRASKYE